MSAPVGFAFALRYSVTFRFSDKIQNTTNYQYLRNYFTANDCENSFIAWCEHKHGEIELAIINMTEADFIEYATNLFNEYEFSMI